MSLADSVSQFITDAGLAHSIVNGSATTVVQTGGGPVSSFAKLQSDNAGVIAGATAAAAASAASANFAAGIAGAFNSGTAMDCGLITDTGGGTYDMGTLT